ncbi:stage V sporulation protein AA [Evansella caseinilytica]|uniref:Stage V sporulation protein AA n=1 Tax=Evansella caseinilytica TaxID=1503961 RepID=A0A1H3L6A8_9BACI|nr:stage V sporulation protein AA [Evansella caseinilytica]SDY59921.1 stage V sporulation protein AA [Evansella caseinilytica]
MEKKVYIRLRSRHWSALYDTLHLRDIAQVITEGIAEAEITRLPVCKLTKKDRTIRVIDAMEIVRLLQKIYCDVDVQVIGPIQTIVYIQSKRKRAHPFLFAAVWLLLFIGAGLAVMNFHEDVSMQGVHIKIHEAITGRKVERPLWLQIPYSVGLGLGMLLFFNHVFKKRINEEPSPMEVEMFNYQENMDRYISVNENEAWKNND